MRISFSDLRAISLTVHSFDVERVPVVVNGPSEFKLRYFNHPETIGARLAILVDLPRSHGG